MTLPSSPWYEIGGGTWTVGSTPTLERRAELLTLPPRADTAGTYYDVHPRPSQRHRCTTACEPYDGPIVQGRRGPDGTPLEDVTEGRAS